MLGTDVSFFDSVAIVLAHIYFLSLFDNVFSEYLFVKPSFLLRISELHSDYFAD